jgi:drug/metabolite transporter (DMT)-like permease
MTPALFAQTTLLTLLAMIAFASNAVLCRWALDGGWIDPVSFMSLRLSSGAAMLFVVMSWMGWQQARNRRKTNDQLAAVNTASKGSWKAAFILFIYAITFSYGYVEISTATGSLLLASVVQFTMIGYALRNGEKLHGAEWIGAALALIGLLYLVYPKLTTPSWWGLVMVVISAYTWALYSLNGRRSLSPLRDTAYNFYRTLPMVVVASLLSLVFIEQVHLTTKGIGIAIFSGGITTSLGYILWYKALPRISSSLASASQLLVPLLAAFGATLFIDEPITLRFIIAAALMMAGLGMVLLGRNQHRKAALHTKDSV